MSSLRPNSKPETKSKFEKEIYNLDLNQIQSLTLSNPILVRLVTMQYTYLKARFNGRLNDKGEDHHVLVAGALLHCLLLLGLPALLAAVPVCVRNKQLSTSSEFES